jgi:hypothetical protein
MAAGCVRTSGAGEAPPPQSPTLTSAPAAAVSPAPAAASAFRTSRPRPGGTRTVRSSPPAGVADKPSPQAHRSSAAAETLSTGAHPGGLFRSAPGYFCTDERTFTPGYRLPGVITAERLKAAPLCTGDYADGAAVTLHLSRRGEATRRFRLDALGDGLVFTRSVPLGRWSARVTSPGVAPATAVVRITRARTPAVYRISGHSPSGGAGMTVELAGFPARSRVQMFLYGPRGDDDLEFIRALPVAVIGADGEGQYSVTARRGDPPGDYGIWSRLCDDGGGPDACALYSK